MTNGAVRPPHRRAATNVLVCQCPCGTAATRRWPRGLRPRNRAMLVLAQVSSMKTSRAGFKCGCCSRQATRAAAMSGRSCSAACSCFFVRQAKPIERRPGRAVAGRYPMLGQQPCPQLRDRCVRPRRHPRAQRRFIAGELTSERAPLGAGRGFTRRTAPRQHLVDIRHADPKQRRHLVDSHAAVHRRQHPIPQILRIRPPALPAHRLPPVINPEPYESHLNPAPEPQISIPLTAIPL